MRRLALVLCLLALSACSVPAPQSAGAPRPDGFNPELAARNFVDVIDRVEPEAERLCRARAPQLDCDFQIVVDGRRGQPPNAFQTLDQRGRPVIAFTLSLIADARNQDELAFILGHEASHHIAGHLARSRENARRGAYVLGSMAQASGQSPSQIRSAARLGAQVGALSYSKEFELEADALGTVIAKRAGFDPVRGAAFFTRIPDPGDTFLGSHPPNADRLAVVRATAARM